MEQPMTDSEHEAGPAWFDRVFGFPARRPWLTIIAALLILLLSIAGMMRLHASTDIRSILAKGDPSAEAMTQIVERYGFMDEMFVLVEVPAKPQAGEMGERELSALRSYAQRFVAAVQNDVDARLMSRRVSWSASPQYRQFAQQILVPSSVFYLSDSEYATLEERLKPDQMAKLIASSETMLTAPGPVGSGLAELTTRDPLRLHEFMLSRLQQQRRAMPTYNNEEAFITPDGSMLMIRVSGVKPAGDLEFAKNFTAALSDLIEKAEPNADGVPLHVELTGAYAIAAHNERSIRGDMVETIVGTTLLLPLLLFLAYRSVLIWPLVMAPLAWGIAVSFGVYSLISTAITPLTCAIGAVLAGLGVNYCVHYLTQYMANRRAKPQAGAKGGGTAEVTAEAATVLTARTVGLAVTSACATSLLAFVAIGFSNVQAIREFAILASLGLLFVGVGVFTLLPALLALTVGSSSKTNSAMTLRFSLEPAIERIAKRSSIWLSISAVIVCAAAAFVLARPGGLLTFEPDLSVMHPRPNPPLDAQRRMAEGFGSDMGGLMILLNVPDSPDASTKLVALAHEVDRRLQQDAPKNAGVGGTLGLSTLLPDPAVAARRAEQLKSLDAKLVTQNLAAAIAKSEYLEPAAYEGYIQLVGKLLTPTAPPTIDSIRGFDELTGAVLLKAAPDDAATHSTPQPVTQSITLLWLTRPLRSENERTAVIDAVRTSLAGLDGVTLTGLSVLGNDTEKAVLSDLTTQVGIAFILVVLWMLATFRSLTDTLLSLLPAVGTLAVLLALMNLAGQRFNLVNLMTLPMLIGIGVDYGIFLVCVVRTHRMSRRMGWTGANRTLVDRFAVDTHALAMTTATAALGLGTLAFTSVPAIQSLGWAAGGAMAACLLLTVFLLMPLLVLREQSWDKRR